MSLDFREETPVGNRHLRVISIKKTFEAMEQCELAWLESIEEEEDRVEDRSRGETHSQCFKKEPAAFEKSSKMRIGN